MGATGGTKEMDEAQGGDIAALFAAYQQDLEQTIADDRWSRMEKHFARDAVYETYGDAGRRTEGRAAVLRRLRREFDAFDRRCQKRRVQTTGGPEVDGQRLLRNWVATFHLDGAADLMIEGSERITFEDGRIVMLEEELSEPSERRLLAWIRLNQHVFGGGSEPIDAPLA